MVDRAGFARRLVALIGLHQHVAQPQEGHLAAVRHGGAQRHLKADALIKGDALFQVRGGDAHVIHAQQVLFQFHRSLVGNQLYLY